MITIKFRGKDIDTGRWLYGDLIQRLGNHPVILTICPTAEGKVGYPREVKEDTVGQFTTLRDKNGKEIYAGDIIYSEFSDGSNCYCLVGWNDEEACFGLMDEYAFRSKQEGYDFPKFDSLVLLDFRNLGTKFEVVGNIHDNPEMIKRK